jgi:YD repeat-containing protein
MGLTETTASQSKTWAYAYDAIDRLQTADRGDGARYGYELDVADNIKSITDVDGTWTYIHGNVIEDEAHTYQWDEE